jgi:hypothetical protein
VGTVHGLCAAILVVLIGSCQGSAQDSAGPTLHVEEHQLLEAPTSDPLLFRPLEGSMDSVLAAHATERSQGIALESFWLEGQYSLKVMLGTDELVATEYYTGDGSAGWVTLKRNGKDIYRIETGMASPVTSLRGLWTYDGHWVLETAYVTLDDVSGRLTRDGRLLNDNLGYSNVFNFGLMRDRPFYFFTRRGKIGYSFDGRESMPVYDEIPHYGCCSAAGLNPRHAREMVAFFARKGDTWYYVEITSGS